MSHRSTTQSEGAQTEDPVATQHRQSAPSKVIEDNLHPPTSQPRQNGLAANSYRACLSDTPATTAPNSPKIPPRRQDSGHSSTSTRSRPTTLDIPGLTKSKVSPDGKIAQRDVGSKLVIVMVGLPARGKSYVTKKMARYLNWLQHDTRIFNVGERRRVAAGSASRPLTAVRVGSSTFPDLVQIPDFNPTTLDQRLKQSRKPVFGSPSPTTTVLVNGELPAEEISADILPPPALEAIDFVDVEPSDHTNRANGNGIESAPTEDVPSENPHNAPDATDQSANFFDPENAEAS
ncbi:MAG: hypothetical protein Q9183_006752, partial [Haloplaca sp. 2 TL-2023]